MADERNIFTDIFYPFWAKEMSRLESDNSKLVHYTSSENAYNIIKSKSIWLRKTSSMNDFSEIKHGIECLLEVYNNHSLKELLKQIFPQALDEIHDLFNGHINSFKEHTYLACFSEQDNEEDNLGRLSMWRAYGSNNGVALVLKNTPFVSEVDDLNAFTIPVKYYGENEVRKMFDDLANNISKNQDLVKELGAESFIATIFYFLAFVVFSTKHKSFKEEREWRVVYNPKLYFSEYIEKSVEVIRGISQPVYKIKLENIPKINFFNAEIHELVEKIIIGPSAHPEIQKEAFEDLLRDAGVDNPEDRVIISSIPLR